MKKREINKLLLESALIVFSVLFALFINRLAENYKVQQQKRVALERIHNELTMNLSILEMVVKQHQKIFTNLSQVINHKNDTLRTQLLQKAYVDFELLSEGGSLYPRLPSSTSWDAARSTGIVSEFEYESVELLTDVYSSREFIISITLQKITDELFEVEHSDMEKKLIELQLLFTELIVQEETMIERLKEALRKV